MSQGPGGGTPISLLPPGSYDVLAHVHGYPPHLFAGAEFMLHTLLRRLLAEGFRVLVTTPRYNDMEACYDLDGIHVLTSRHWGDTVEHLIHAQLVVTHLGMHPKVVQYATDLGKPTCVVVHNDHSPTAQHLRQHTPTFAVWNTEWVRDTLMSGSYWELWRDADPDCWLTGPPLPEIPGIVVHPPVLLDEYRTVPGDRVTLINHNVDKGGRVLQRLAARMPDHKFLAVNGSHGRQLCWATDNLEVAPGTMNMRDDVYARTRVLVMPSVYESFGRTAVEAMCSGIPVVAHPTPGLRECLGGAGIFADRDDTAAWVEAIRSLDDPDTYAAASAAALRRADELDPTEGLDRWAEAATRLIEGTR